MRKWQIKLGSPESIPRGFGNPSALAECNWKTNFEFQSSLSVQREKLFLSNSVNFRFRKWNCIASTFHYCQFMSTVFWQLTNWLCCPPKLGFSYLDLSVSSLNIVKWKIHYIIHGSKEDFQSQSCLDLTKKNAIFIMTENRSTSCKLNFVEFSELSEFNEKRQIKKVQMFCFSKKILQSK